MNLIDAMGETTFKTTSPRNDYNELCIVGKGNYGTVWRAESTKPDPTGCRRQVALKEFKTPPSSSLNGLTPDSITEIMFLSELHHPAICHAYEIYLYKSAIYITMPFMYPLKRVMQVGLGIDDIRELTRSFLDGIAYCHTNRITHFDLKPDNILIHSSGQLVISDLGIAHYMRPHVFPQAPIGTLCYRAPELVLSTTKADYTADLWSAGATIFYIATGEHLVQCGNGDWINQIEELVRAIGRPPQNLHYSGVQAFSMNILRSCSAGLILSRIEEAKPLFAARGLSELWDIINRMLSWVPSERLSAQKALEQHFFTDHYTPLFELNLVHNWDMIPEDSIDIVLDPQEECQELSVPSGLTIPDISCQSILQANSRTSEDYSIILLKDTA